MSSYADAVLIHGGQVHPHPLNLNGIILCRDANTLLSIFRDPKMALHHQLQITIQCQKRLS